MRTVKDVLLKTAAFLGDLQLPHPRKEAEELLGHVLGLTRVQVYLEFDRPLDDGELAAIRGLVRRRANREPLYWLLGSVGFHAFDHLEGKAGGNLSALEAGECVADHLGHARVGNGREDLPRLLAPGEGTGVQGSPHRRKGLGRVKCQLQ